MTCVSLNVDQTLSTLAGSGIVVSRETQVRGRLSEKRKFGEGHISSDDNERVFSHDTSSVKARVVSIDYDRACASVSSQSKCATLTSVCSILCAADLVKRTPSLVKRMYLSRLLARWRWRSPCS